MSFCDNCKTDPDIFSQELYSVYNPSLEIIICKITTVVSEKLIAG
jgi:hypothetical protein